MRTKQDARHAIEQRRTTILGGAFIPVAAFVPALLASPAIEATSAQVRAVGILTLLSVLANGICWFLANGTSAEWAEGADIEGLMRAYPSRPNAFPALLRQLIAVNGECYRRNEHLLRRVKFWFGVQVTLILCAVTLLMGAVLVIG